MCLQNACVERTPPRFAGGVNPQHEGSSFAQRFELSKHFDLSEHRVGAGKALRDLKKEIRSCELRTVAW